MLIARAISESTDYRLEILNSSVRFSTSLETAFRARDRRFPVATQYRAIRSRLKAPRESDRSAEAREKGRGVGVRDRFPCLRPSFSLSSRASLGDRPCSAGNALSFVCTTDSAVQVSRNKRLYSYEQCQSIYLLCTRVNSEVKFVKLRAMPIRYRSSVVTGIFHGCTAVRQLTLTAETPIDRSIDRCKVTRCSDN